MTDIDDEGTVDKTDRLEETGSTVKRAWVQTVDDMNAMAEERREQGWEVVTLPAGDTTPVSKDDGDDESRFGLVYVIADNHAEEFTEVFEEDRFTHFEAYRNEIDGFVFLVTELLDPESETAVMLAGQYELRNAAAMVASAKEEGALYSHVRTLDGTHLGSFRHEEYDPLVPKADKLDQFVPSRGPAGDDE